MLCRALTVVCLRSNLKSFRRFAILIAAKPWLRRLLPHHLTLSAGTQCPSKNQSNIFPEGDQRRVLVVYVYRRGKVARPGGLRVRLCAAAA